MWWNGNAKWRKTEINKENAQHINRPLCCTYDRWLLKGAFLFSFVFCYFSAQLIQTDFSLHLFQTNHSTALHRHYQNSGNQKSIPAKYWINIFGQERTIIGWEVVKLKPLFWEHLHMKVLLVSTSKQCSVYEDEPSHDNSVQSIRQLDNCASKNTLSLHKWNNVFMKRKTERVVYQNKFTVRCGHRSTAVSLIRRCHRRNLFVFLFEQNRIEDPPVNSQLPLQKQLVSTLYNATNITIECIQIYLK